MNCRSRQFRPTPRYGELALPSAHPTVALQAVVIFSDTTKGFANQIQAATHITKVHVDDFDPATLKISRGTATFWCVDLVAEYDEAIVNALSMQLQDEGDKL